MLEWRYGCTHTHDDVDWAARLEAMRRFDTLDRQAHAAVAERLGTTVSKDGTVIDVGPGAGGMSALFGELLCRATRLPRADLLWASGMVHHLPDQQAALDRLAGIPRSGGVLALAEGGLEARCLPTDVGVGAHGLEERLLAAREVWFRELRENMAGSVRMPYGWSSGLTRAGLASASSFSYLVEHPAPPTPLVREYVVDRLSSYTEQVAEWLDAGDRAALDRLLDESDPEYAGARDDFYLLLARTVHYGWRP